MVKANPCVLDLDSHRTVWMSFERDLKNSSTIAVDTEGYNLGRDGALSIVQIATASGIYIVDVMSLAQHTEHPTIQLLKRVFESREVIKVIHDARMDADILHHQYNIGLKNVHDTQIFHSVICNTGDVNLNNMLHSYGFSTNDARDTSVYQTSPKFWLTRPLTTRMIEWSSGDVSHLLEVARIQTMLTSSAQLYKACCSSSMWRIDQWVASSTGSFNIKQHKVGLFVGKGGRNIRRIISDSGVHLTGPNNSGLITYYARDISQIAKLMLLCKEYIH